MGSPEFAISCLRSDCFMPVALQGYTSLPCGSPLKTCAKVKCVRRRDSRDAILKCSTREAMRFELGELSDVLYAPTLRHSGDKASRASRNCGTVCW